MEWNTVVIRLCLAGLFGALIGLERERKDWAAGLRTHMMVCVGSCLIMIVSAFGFKDILGTANVVLDPSRIAAQVVSGIGFIGAGTILFLRKGIIRGLTTAAGLWTVAAIGLAAGGGLYFAAAATTVIALIILWGLKPLENAYDKKYKRKILKITTHTNIDNTSLLKDLLDNKTLNIKNFSLEKEGDRFILALEIDRMSMTQIEQTTNVLKSYQAIKEISWE